MKIKNLLLFSTSLAMVGITPSVFAFAEVARGKLTASARIAYSHDTNIFANNNEVSDYSIIFTPSLSFARNVGTVTTSAQLSVSSISFTDTKGQDSIDPSLAINIRADRGQKGSVSQSFNYARSSNANEALNDRAESNEVRAATRINYFYSEKTGIRVNASYRLSDFLSLGYNSVESYTIGGGLIYKYSPKLTAVATYSYRPEKATELLVNPISNPSSKNHRFEVGLEGELAPKVTGDVSVGMVYRDFDLGGNTNTILVKTVISWQVDQKTNLSLNAANDFDTTPGAESAEDLSIGLNSRHNLTAKLNVGASVRYTHAKLQERPGPTRRTDESTTFGVNAQYRFNDNFNLEGSLSWRDNESTLARAVYKRNVATIAARYNF